MRHAVSRGTNPPLDPRRRTGSPLDPRTPQHHPPLDRAKAHHPPLDPRTPQHHPPLHPRTPQRHTDTDTDTDTDTEDVAAPSRYAASDDCQYVQVSSSPRPRRPWRRWSALAVGAALLLGGCGDAAETLTPDRVAEAERLDDAPAAAEPTRLQLVVSPHPDDELEAWSQVDRSPDVYTVWLTMTRGEATAHCDPDVHTAELDVRAGEIPPSPPPEGAGTASCVDARMASWTTFLRLAWPAPVEEEDQAGDDVPSRSTAPAPQRLDLPDQPAGDGTEASDVPTRDGRPSPGALAWVEPAMAMIALDAGDGQVSEDDVARGVRAVLAQRGRLLPDLPLARVVAAAYTGSLPDAPYDHPDHLAVTEALLERSLTQALAPQDGTFVVTGTHDPRATLTSEVDRAEYRRLMGLGPAVTGDDGSPSPQRLGLAQRVYGWLAFPGGAWPPTETAVPDADGDPLIMARVQRFAHLPGPDG